MILNAIYNIAENYETYSYNSLKLFEEFFEQHNDLIFFKKILEIYEKFSHLALISLIVTLKSCHHN